MLHIVQSNRLEALADALAQALSADAGPVFETQTVVVQDRGVARWLSLGLAERMGIAANLDYPFPASLLWRLFAQALPDIPRESPFDPAVLTWRFMKLLDSSSAAMHPRLARALAEGEVKRKYELALRLAVVFDRYLIYRPEWIDAWAHGKQLGLGADESWQAQLWRDLAKTLPAASRAHPAARFYAAMENDPALRAALPRTLHLFAVQALPPMYMEVFRRLAEWTDIRLYALNPCREYWGDIVRTRDIARADARSEGENYLAVGHPLLASLGRHGRAFFDSLAEAPAEETDLFVDSSRASRLTRLQNDMLNLNPSADWTPDPTDVSIQVHICHSAMREVEVLHDRLLDAFDRDPSLRASDVLVLVPQLDDYAPAIDAVFATAPDSRRLPYAIADRAAQNDNGLLRSFFKALRLHESRFEAEELLALLEQAPIAQRYAIGTDDFPLLRQWVRESGIRWGYDEHARAALDLPATRAHSWQAGFDRLFLGYAMAGERHVLYEGLLPYEDVEGGSAQLIGRLKSFVDNLAAIAGEVRQPRRLSQWKTWTEILLSRLYALDDLVERDAQAIRAAMTTLLADARRAAFDEPVPVDVWRAQLEALLDASPRQDAFLSGGITFAALRALRAVPARVVAVLGLNAGQFPRNPVPLSFDLIDARRRAGDRHLRDEDRYALLEAVLAARERLYLSYTGRSVRDDSELPSSPLVDELLEALRAPEQRAQHPGLAIHHPLQAFSRRYFDGSDARLFSYSTDYAAASRVAAGPRAVSPFFAAADLPRLDAANEPYSLQTLQRFLRNPTQFFFVERLDLRLAGEEDLIDEAEPFNPDALSLAFLRRETLEHLLAGQTPQSTHALARAGGHLPLGASGDVLYARITSEIQPLYEAIAAGGPFQRQSFMLERGPFKLNGSVSGFGPLHSVLWHPGHVRADRLLAFWAAHLLVNAAGFERHSYIYSLDRTHCFSPVESATAQLEALCALMQEGLRRPPALFAEASFAYAQAVKDAKEDPLALALRQWQGTDRTRGDCDDPYVALAYRGADNPLGEDFARLARMVFDPLLAALDHD